MLEPCTDSRTFYEFFAGSGMVRAGLGDSWTCLFANDFDHKKAAAYKEKLGREASCSWAMLENSLPATCRVALISLGPPSRAKTFPWRETVRDLMGGGLEHSGRFGGLVHCERMQRAAASSDGIYLGLVALARDLSEQYEAFSR